MNSLTTRRSALAFFGAVCILPYSAKAEFLKSSPLLWRADGAHGTAYLFGQLPVQADTDWQTPTVMDAFEASQTLWLENPIFSSAEAQARQAEVAKLSRTSTAEFLPDQDLHRLRSQLRMAGLEANAFDRVPADDVFQQIAALADARAQADYTRLPERIFREQAIAAAKPIVTEWKSLDEVANFIPPAPSLTRLQLIRMGLDQFDTAHLASERLHAWLSGDVQYFERLGSISAHRYPELLAKLSEERNSRLADRLAASLRSPGRHFVCVGIGHLTGPGSVGSQLLKRGISVYRV